MPLTLSSGRLGDEYFQLFRFQQNPGVNRILISGMLSNFRGNRLIQFDIYLVSGQKPLYLNVTHTRIRHNNIIMFKSKNLYLLIVKVYAAKSEQ